MPRVYLAPLHGFTDLKYRTAHQTIFGSFDKAVAPFVTLVAGRKVKPSHLHELDPQKNKMAVEPQVIGNEADFFITMAHALTDLGYPSVNWNLGCPIKAIAAKQRGSGLLAYPERVARFLDQVLPLTEIKLSIKMRLGYSQAEESIQLIDVLNRYPLEYVIIHSRLGVQMYEGTVDLDALEVRKSILKHKTIYNGDVFNVRFPWAEEVMIGRGILANPFLASELKGEEMSVDEKTQKFWDFMEFLFREYQEEDREEDNILHRMKQYWASLRVEGSEELFKKLKYVQTLQEYSYLCSSEKEKIIFRK
ncbi:MAG: tRNA-dihydrouridine synthase family protein [Bacteroidales bacterium]